MVHYLVSHYVPAWFNIRENSSCVMGSRNLFRSVELLRDLPQYLQDVIKPVITRNGYWAHPEQVLLAMVADGDPRIRKEAVKLIRSARQVESREVRDFVLPSINFNASRYTELIDWNRESVTQPPLLRDVSDAEIQAIERDPWQAPSYPAHTQAVERAVRVVTEASAAVANEEARHGLITARLEHRGILPVFNAKKDFHFL